MTVALVGDTAELRSRKQGWQEAVDAIVDHLRHTAGGYALLRSIRANGARDALYQTADKLEKDWKEIVLPRAARST